jgi:hypothetical protein
MMARKRAAAKVAQAWIELVTADPEAVSALAVVRAHLAAGRAPRRLRRLRVVELVGALPEGARIGELLHRSIQFYNPHKERCVVRLAAADAAPLAPGEQAVLVIDRGEERRAAAERWWRHETGKSIEVREGVVWVMTFDSSVADPAAAARELAVVRDRRHGLFCNPHAQEHALASAEIPLPWMTAAS